MGEACLLFGFGNNVLFAFASKRNPLSRAPNPEKGLWNLLAMCLCVPGVVAEVDWSLVITLFSAETTQDS